MKKNNKKTILFIFIFLFILLSSIGTIYYYYYFKLNNNESFILNAILKDSLKGGYKVIKAERCSEDMGKATIIYKDYAGGSIVKERYINFKKMVNDVNEPILSCGIMGETPTELWNPCVVEYNKKIGPYNIYIKTKEAINETCKYNSEKISKTGLKKINKEIELE